MLKFVKAKVIGSDWVTRLQPTKKEAKVLKDKADVVGVIYYIDDDLEMTTLYYQVGSNPVAVKIRGIPRYKVEEIMDLYPGAWVHGYIKSNSTFEYEEVLIRTELINYGLYTVEEDTSEDCVDGSEEDTSEDCVDGSEEDTSEDCVDGSELWADEEEDTSIKGEVTMKFINGKLNMNDCGDGLELCPHKEEDTTEDYNETTNVHGVPIKNYCLSFKEAMLIHEAVGDNLNAFIVDLSLERLALFNDDIDCTLGLDEQYNNMVTGFIVFGAVLNIFTFDATHSKDIYLNYLERTYNLSKWGVQMLSDLIDIGINLDSSVIEPHSFTSLDCLKSFIRIVGSSVCFESHRFLDVEKVMEKLQKEDLFYKVAKFYLTMVCWGKFEPAPRINTVTIIVDFDYPKIVRDYNNYLELFEQDDMQELLTTVAEELHLDTELLEKCEAIDIIDKDMAIYILNKWDKYKKIKFHLIPDDVQTKLLILYHVIRKIKGVH